MDRNYIVEASRIARRMYLAPEGVPVTPKVCRKAIGFAQLAHADAEAVDRLGACLTTGQIVAARAMLADIAITASESEQEGF